MMRHVPWITLIAAAVFCVSPLGQDVIYSSFFSGEQLARNLSQFLLMVIVAIVIALAALEWGLKIYLRKRRSKGAAGS